MFRSTRGARPFSRIVAKPSSNMLGGFVKLPLRSFVVMRKPNSSEDSDLHTLLTVGEIRLTVRIGTRSFVAGVSYP